MRPSTLRLRDRFNTVWEVNSLSLRIHMVEQGMGVTFIDHKLLQEHPACADFQIMDDVSFGSIVRQVGLYYRAGRHLSASARNFIAICERFWRL
jgi:DNA-binding transcriptional LysR family regulator